MRSLRSPARGALQLAILLACLGFGSRVARAESITYTFTGIGSFTGTDFSYTSPSGFLSSPTGILTVNPGGVVVASIGLSGSVSLADFYLLPDVTLPSYDVLALDYSPGAPIGDPGFIVIDPLYLSSIGVQPVDSPSQQIPGVFMYLTIEPTPMAEPSSLSLLLSGILALCLLAGVYRAFGPPDAHPRLLTLGDSDI